MTATNKERRVSDADEIIVRDKGGPPRRFKGKKIAELVWTPDDALERGYMRWTDMTLYRVEEGNAAYVVQVIGRSIVYHRPGSRCRKGVPTRIQFLDDKRYQSLEPCPEAGCQPEDLDDLSPSESVSVEGDFHSLIICGNAEEFIEAMNKKGTHDQESGLNRRLLRAAVEVDPAIAEAEVRLNAQSL